MRKFGMAALLSVAATAVGLQAGPAAAAINTFTPFASTPDGLPVQVSIEFADGAGPVSGTKAGGGFSGIVDFLFKVGSFEADLGDLLAIQAACAPANPPCASGMKLDYDLAPEIGSIWFNDTNSDFRFSYGAGLASGSFNTDFIGPADCRISNTCNFRGSWTEVSEPAVALLLVGGLAVSGMARRRRA
jgi:hypothetical protein